MYLPRFEPGASKIRSSCWNHSSLFSIAQWYAAGFPVYLYSVFFWKYCYVFIVVANISQAETSRSSYVWWRITTPRTALREFIGMLWPNRRLSLCVFVYNFLLLCEWLSATNDTICRQPSSRCLHDLYIETHVSERTQERWEFGYIFRFQLLW